MEKIYQQNNELKYLQWLYPIGVTIWFVYISYDFLLELLQKVFPYFWLSMVILAVLYLLIFKWTYRLNTPEKQKIVINASGIQTSVQKIIWTDSIQVFEITDFASSIIERIYAKDWKTLIGKSKNQAFVVVDTKQESHSFMDILKVKTPTLLISTNQWQIDDFNDLRDFLEQIGHPAQPLSAKQSIQYFPKVTDLGRLSAIVSYLSIGFVIIGIIVSKFDAYATVDYRIMKYGFMTIAIVAGLGCFWWVKTDKKMWIIQALVAVLFAVTFTFMMGSISLALTQLADSESEMTFKYVGKVDGVKHWSQVDNTNNGIDCREVNVEVGTSKTVEVIQPLGMTRVKEADLCMLK